MQLPDCAFGERWPIILQGAGSTGIPVYRISMGALPEWTVIWEIWGSTCATVGSWCRFRFRLGDQLPTTEAQFQGMDALFRGFEDYVGLGSAIMFNPVNPPTLRRLRVPVHAAGRRLVMGFDVTSAIAQPICAGLVISSIPKEVPDWLISGHR